VQDCVRSYGFLQEGVRFCFFLRENLFNGYMLPSKYMRKFLQVLYDNNGGKFES
jgi:hypothetical protein